MNYKDVLKMLDDMKAAIEADHTTEALDDGGEEELTMHPGEVIAGLEKQRAEAAFHAFHFRSPEKEAAIARKCEKDEAEALAQEGMSLAAKCVEAPAAKASREGEAALDSLRRSAAATQGKQTKYRCPKCGSYDVAQWCKHELHELRVITPDGRTDGDIIHEYHAYEEGEDLNEFKCNECSHDGSGGSFDADQDATKLISYLTLRVMDHMVRYGLAEHVSHNQVRLEHSGTKVNITITKA